MILEEYVNSNRPQFVAKTRHIADKLNILPEQLMAVMWFESKLDSKAQNSISGATGLIQFMPRTAISLGTTTSDLLQMSNVEQLDYVYEYLKPYAGKMKTVEDVYLAVFYPVAIAKPDDYQLGGYMVASQNPIFDLNGDNKVKKHEVKQKFIAALPAGVAETIKKKKGQL